MALAETITLSVDAANNGNPANQVYTRFDSYQNRSLYIGADHLPDARNTLGFYRTFPTASGNFKGVCKTSVKFTQDVEVAGKDSSTTLTSPIIADLSFSVPVGVTASDLVEVRQRLLALIDGDTLMNSLNIQQQV